MSLVDDIAGYLESASTVFTRYGGTGGNLARQAMLDNLSADPMTVVYETPGFGNEYVYSTSTTLVGMAFERPSFQILSRATDYQTARSRAETAYLLLDGLSNRGLPTSTGTAYAEITAVQAPFWIGPDANGRPIVSTNYNVRKAHG